MGTGRASSREGSEWALTYRCVGTEDEAHRAWEAVHRLLREAGEDPAPGGRAAARAPSERAPGGSALAVGQSQRRPATAGPPRPAGPLGRDPRRRGEARAGGLL